MHSIFVLIFIHLAAVSTPGPDTLIVIRESSVSKKNGVLCILGICIGVLFYSLLIVLGLSFILNKYHFIHYIISILGACYLAWIGISLLKAKGLSIPSEQVENKIKRKSILTGLFTNLSNPKAIIYFTSIFSQFNFIDPFKISLAVILIIVVTFFWFLFVSLIINTPKIKNYFFKKSILIDKISGGIFLIFSLVLLIDILIKR